MITQFPFDFFFSTFFIIFIAVFVVVFIIIVVSIIYQFKYRKRIFDKTFDQFDIQNKIYQKETVLVVCPYCKHRNPETNKKCEKCSAPL
jgi:membrane protein YdbS with pleckstrin-like domain